MNLLRAVPMVHLQVQVPNRDAPAVTRQIAAQGLLHLIDIAHGSAAPAKAVGGTADTQALLARFRDLAREIRQVADTLEVTLSDVAGSLPAPAADYDTECRQIGQHLHPLRDQVRAAAERLHRALEDRTRLAASMERSRRLRAAGVDAGRLSALRYACVRVGAADSDAVVALAGHLSPAPFVIVPLETSGARPLSAVVVPASSRERLDAALRVSTFEPVEASAETTPMEPSALQRQLDQLTEEEESARTALNALRDPGVSILQELSARAGVAILLLQAQSMFASAGRFLVISGWIPEDRAPELTAAIARVSSGRAVVSVDKPEDLPAAYADSLKVPILHRNPLLLRPFQSLIQIYGVPSYSEIQPTAFFALSFLLMFGLMFGDVGQGLVLVAAGYCLFRYLPRFLDYGIILMEAGAASALFGVLYGSVFGLEHVLPSLWLHPIRDLPRFATIAIGLGVLLVSGGIILNVVNSWRAGERLAALAGTRGLLGAFVYWITLALIARAILPAAWQLPDAGVIALCAVAIALLAGRPMIVRALGVDRSSRTPATPAPTWLAALEGSVELVDAIFSYFANTISFVRVAAFAAVHAGIFIAMFALADTFARFRFGGPLSIVVLVAGNAAMILLEGLTVTVQVLRLEYYEFFSKFFRGGGELYRPLMLRPNATQGGL